MTDLKMSWPDEEEEHHQPAPTRRPRRRGELRECCAGPGGCGDATWANADGDPREAILVCSHPHHWRK